MAITVGELIATLKLKDELTAQLQHVNKSLDDAKKQFSDTGKSVGDLESLLGATKSGGLGGALDLIVGKFGVVGTAVTLAGTALAAVGATALKAGYDAAELGGMLDDMSEVTGVSVESLSEWRFAVEASGFSMDKFQNLLFIMQNRMENSPDEFRQGLNRIGVEVDDITKMKPEELLLKMSNQWRKMGPEVNQAAAAMEVFGRQGRDAIPFLNEPLEELLKRSKELGFTWSEEMAAAAEDLERESRILGMQFKELWNDIGARLIPAIRGAVNIFGSMMDVGRSIAGMVGSLLQPQIDALSTAFEYATSAGEGVSGFFGDILGPALNAASFLWEKMTDAARGSADGLNNVLLPALDRVKGAIQTITPWVNYALQLDKTREAYKELGGWVDAARGEITQAKDAADFKPWADLNMKGLEPVTLSSKEQKDVIIQLTTEMNANNKAREEAAKKAKEQKDALDQIRGSTVELTEAEKRQVESAMATGVSAETIAKAYDLNSQAVRNYMSLQEGLKTLHEEVVAGGKRSLKELVETGQAWMDASTSRMTEVFLMTVQNQKDIAQAGTDELWKAKLAMEEALAGLGDPPPGMEVLWQQAAQSIIDKFNLTIEQGYEDVGPTLEQAGRGAAGAASKPWMESISALAESFANLSQIAGESFGNIAKAAGTVISSIDAGHKSFGTFQTGLGEATKAGGSFTQGLMGMATGALGIAGAVGSVIGVFKQLFHDAEKEINPFRQAFIDAGGGIDAMGEKARQAGTTLKAVLDAKNPEQYKKAIEDLNTAFATQDAAMKTLDETAKRYGFTIEELGPAFSRQKLSEQAAQLYQDYEVLIAGGLDNVAVLTRMSDATNDYVQKALSMGMEVPVAMRPMLERMAEMGLLTDAQGNKITDLEGAGITFSETMTQGFQKVVTAVETLTTAIARGLGLSLDEVLPKGTAKTGEFSGALYDATLDVGGLQSALYGLPIDQVLPHAATQTDGFSGSLIYAKSNVDGLGYALSGLPAPQVMQDASAWTNGFTGSVMNGTTNVQTLGTAISGLPAVGTFSGATGSVYGFNSALMTATGNAWSLNHAVDAIPNYVPIDIHYDISSSGSVPAGITSAEAWEPVMGVIEASMLGFASGTGGRYLDFGEGTPVMLHGRERVMTEEEAAGGGSNWDVVKELNKLRLMFQTLPDMLVRTQRDAALLAAAGRR